MNKCRMTFRFFAILFGLTGMIALTWLGYESYSLARQAREINQEFFTTVDRGIENIDGKCARLHETFDKSVIQLEELEDRLREVTRRVIDNRVAESVSETARTVSVQMDQATEVLKLTSDLLEVALKIRRQPEAKPDQRAGNDGAPPDWHARVRDLQSLVQRAMSSLKDLQQQLTKLQSEPREVLERRDLTDRLLRIVGKVKGVRDVLANVRTNLLGLQETLKEKQSAYDTLIGQLWWLVLCVALWMGLGQFCLMKYLFRANDSPAPIQKSE